MFWPLKSKRERETQITEQLWRDLLRVLILCVMREADEPVPMHWIYSGVRLRIREFTPRDVVKGVRRLVERGELLKRRWRVCRLTGGTVWEDEFYL
jgi:hypothetical protein